MAQARMIYVMCSLAICLLTTAMIGHLGRQVRQSLHGTIDTRRLREINNVGEDFAQIAIKHGTDKVTTHSYELMYGKYLAAYKTQKIKMLEIGLGCNMPYGPGASYRTWLEYIPQVDLYFIEYDEACVAKFNGQNVGAQVYVGDQANASFLRDFVLETTSSSLFDMIIDDGGHGMQQQMTSLEVLWKAVKPGGGYIVEDLQTSYWDQYGGDASSSDSNKMTTAKYLHSLIDEMMRGEATTSIGSTVQSVECMAEICCLQKEFEVGREFRREQLKIAMKAQG